MVKEKYFPVLDILRLFASMGVLITHSITFYNDTTGYNLHFSNLMVSAGYFGVIFFYVLSGFLITYLLLAEKSRTGTIVISKFYIRRMLRIWPLYYLIIILSFLVLPHLSPWHNEISLRGSKNSFLLYLLFLPNIVSLFNNYFNIACFHTYTVGYEEQFYLFWPIILRKLNKYIVWIFIFLFFFPFLLELFHLWIIKQHPKSNNYDHAFRGILTFINYFNFQAFIAGAIAGLMFISPKFKFYSVIAGTRCTLLLSIVILLLMYWGPSYIPGYVNIVSLVFAVFIFNLVQLPTCANKIFYWMSQLGKTSYSIYIFHPAVLLFSSFLLSRGVLKKIENHHIEYLEYLIVSIFLVLAVSLISYKYFESTFLKKKVKFEPEKLINKPLDSA